MTLDPNLILAIDKARINGESIATIRAALEAAGHDHTEVLAHYKFAPFADGRRRGDVNLSDPREWGS